MLKRFCNRCDKELNGGWSMLVHLQKNKEDKESHKSIMEQVDLCEECYDETIKEFNEILGKLKVEKFVERA